MMKRIDWIIVLLYYSYTISNEMFISITALRTLRISTYIPILQHLARAHNFFFYQPPTPKVCILDIICNKQSQS